MTEVDRKLLVLVAFVSLLGILNIVAYSIKIYRRHKEMARMTINGQTFEVPDGANVSVNRGVITVNGVTIQNGLSGVVEVKWEGPMGNLTSSASVSCGDVDGSVDAGGSVSCGNVNGDVDAGGSVSCGNVGGDVDAGGSINMRR